MVEVQNADMIRDVFFPMQDVLNSCSIPWLIEISAKMQVLRVPEMMINRWASL